METPDTRCRFVKVNGDRCRLPSKPGSDLCTDHHLKKLYSRGRLRPDPPSRYNTVPLVRFAWAEDHDSVLFNCNQIALALVHDTISARQAGTLNAVMRTCQRSLEQKFLHERFDARERERASATSAPHTDPAGPVPQPSDRVNDFLIDTDGMPLALPDPPDAEPEEPRVPHPGRAAVSATGWEAATAEPGKPRVPPVPGVGTGESPTAEPEEPRVPHPGRAAASATGWEAATAEPEKPRVPHPGRAAVSATGWEAETADPEEPRVPHPGRAAVGATGWEAATAEPEKPRVPHPGRAAVSATGWEAATAEPEKPRVPADDPDTQTPEERAASRREAVFYLRLYYRDDPAMLASLADDPAGQGEPPSAFHYYPEGNALLAQIAASHAAQPPLSADPAQPAADPRSLTLETLTASAEPYPLSPIPYPLYPIPYTLSPIPYPLSPLSLPHNPNHCHTCTETPPRSALFPALNKIARKKKRRTSAPTSTPDSHPALLKSNRHPTLRALASWERRTPPTCYWRSASPQRRG